MVRRTKNSMSHPKVLIDVRRYQFALNPLGIHLSNRVGRLVVDAGPDQRQARSVGPAGYGSPRTASHGPLRQPDRKLETGPAITGQHRQCVAAETAGPRTEPTWKWIYGGSYPPADWRVKRDSANVC